MNTEQTSKNIFTYGVIMVLVCRVILHIHKNKGSSAYGCELLKIIHHPAKFDCHGHCGSGDLVCPMIPQDYVIKASCYFMQGLPINIKR